MNCSNVIYKGEDAVLRFYIEDDYSNLEIKVYTDGKTMVTPSEITTEDGLVTMYFHDGDLDILNDGVIRYDVQYDVDGETIVKSICTNQYLKTPAGYSAMTAEEVYEDGYMAGIRDCESGTCEEAIEMSYQSGYTNGYNSGYTAGQEDCPECSGSTDCSSAITEAFQSGWTDGRLAGMTEQALADAARLTHLTATTNGVYTAPYGYSEVEVNVASGSGDCSEAIAIAYQSGYTAGQEDCGECQTGTLFDTPSLSDLSFGWYNKRWEDVEHSPNLVGWGNVMLDMGYVISESYQSGYTAGQEDCPECSGGTDCSSAITEAYQSGYTEGYAAGQADCPECSACTSNNYFTILNRTASAGTIQIREHGSPNNIKLKVSSDRITWTSYTCSADTFISIPANGCLYFDGSENNGHFSLNEQNCWGFDSNVDIDVFGDIMTLVGNSDTEVEKYVFAGLFSQNTHLINACGLVIPPRTGIGSFYGMFIRCYNLITAPALPATTLERGCYLYMFLSCYNLTTAPALPATTLAQSCYFGMFEECTGLTSLTCLATDISALNCTYEWLHYINTQGTFYCAPSMVNVWENVTVNGYPSTWTIQAYN